MAIDKKTLFYRLKFYGFGFGLGCVLVWATLFYGREERASWLPEGRILEFLEVTDITINDNLKCQLECNNIPINFMDSTFWENADVDFDKSAIKRKPCPEYKITSEGTTVYIEVCEKEEKATLRSFSNLSDKNKICDCN